MLENIVFPDQRTGKVFSRLTVPMTIWHILTRQVTESLPDKPAYHDVNKQNKMNFRACSLNFDRHGQFHA